MTPSFEQRIVFGLLVLCAFYHSPAEAHFKFFPSRSLSGAVRQRQPSLPSTSRTSDSHRRLPSHSAESATNSMRSVNLHSSGSSTSDIYRSASSPALERAGSPMQMHEMSNLHRQAASSLNIRSVNTQRQNTLMQRFRPSPERIISIGKYLKNGAIASAGVGGFISVVNLFSSDSEDKDEISSEKNATIIIFTTTTAPEIDNPLGVDK